MNSNDQISYSTMNPFPCKSIEISCKCRNKHICLHLSTNFTTETKLDQENQLMPYFSTVRGKLGTWHEFHLRISVASRAGAPSCAAARAGATATTRPPRCRIPRRRHIPRHRDPPCIDVEEASSIEPGGEHEWDRVPTA
jgi:hypothetical protein